jgi:hypothetical protein
MRWRRIATPRSICTRKCWAAIVFGTSSASVRPGDRRDRQRGQGRLGRGVGGGLRRRGDGAAGAKELGIVADARLHGGSNRALAVIGLAPSGVGLTGWLTAGRGDRRSVSPRGRVTSTAGAARRRYAIPDARRQTRHESPDRQHAGAARSRQRGRARLTRGDERFAAIARATATTGCSPVTRGNHETARAIANPRTNGGARPHPRDAVRRPAAPGRRRRLAASQSPPPPRTHSGTKLQNRPRRLARPRRRGGAGTRDLTRQADRRGPPLDPALPNRSLNRPPRGTQLCQPPRCQYLASIAVTDARSVYHVDQHTNGSSLAGGSRE